MACRAQDGPPVPANSDDAATKSGADDDHGRRGAPSNPRIEGAPLASDGPPRRRADAAGMRPAFAALDVRRHGRRVPGLGPLLRWLRLHPLGCLRRRSRKALPSMENLPGREELAHLLGDGIPLSGGQRRHDLSVRGCEGLRRGLGRRRRLVRERLAMPPYRPGVRSVTGLLPVARLHERALREVVKSGASSNLRLLAPPPCASAAARVRAARVG